MEKGIYGFASSESVLDLRSYCSLIIKLEFVHWLLKTKNLSVFNFGNQKQKTAIRLFGFSQEIGREREQVAAKSNPSSHSVIECLHIVRAIYTRAEGFSEKEG